MAHEDGEAPGGPRRLATGPSRLPGAVGAGFAGAGKSALIADRKGRRVLVQRAGSEEARARNEYDSSGYGPPRRPTRGYKGKRDLKPRD